MLIKSDKTFSCSTVSPFESGIKRVNVRYLAIMTHERLQPDNCSLSTMVACSDEMRRVSTRELI